MRNVILAIVFVAGTASAAPPLRLLQWNVRGIPFTGFERRLPRIAAVVAQQRPDFVTFEEIFTEGQASQARRALAPLGYASCCPTRGLVRPGGLLLFWDTTKGWTVSDVAFVRFARSAPWRLNEGDRLARKGFLAGSARNADGRAFRIVVTYLQAQYPDHRRHYEDVRLAQAQQLTAAVAGDEQVVVAGDFNTTPDDGVYRWLVSNGWRDTTAELRQRCACGTNFEDGKPTGEWFDYVFVRGAPGTATAEMIRNDYVDEYSDHEAILCTISP